MKMITITDPLRDPTEISFNHEFVVGSFAVEKVVVKDIFFHEDFKVYVDGEEISNE